MTNAEFYQFIHTIVEFVAAQAEWDTSSGLSTKATGVV